MRTKYLLLTAIVLAFFACQKEPDGVLSPANCTLEKIVYYDTDGATPEDTAVIRYNGSQVSRVDYSTIAITLDYTNGKISKRNIMAQGSAIVVYYDQFTYNADGTISKVESYFNALGTPMLYYTYDYTYTNGKIATILEKQDTSSAGSGTLTEVYNYIFNYTGNNITKIDEEDLINHTTDSYTYQYDTKPNYFNKLPNSLYFELEFLDLLTPNLPLVLSENNVTLVENQGDHTGLGYTEDNGNLKTFLLDGTRIAAYLYKCQ